ncbi:Neutral/alkaline nonlysosomal ceramidase [Cryphonectria parasitica EP155]|uniref:Neutral ceramidase n=1 Tax=Cryphonectria parasitica (strain ATCC 38755 / EP155) TaxID=660469 RepID=A0A9P5CI41_CRYP1|nr:Neutral/alkaline nonlysosomal ceramidase [Cryphonectria parasitica EP155]KAF3760504.1 Neutral/alkaline nonlysosomal ceramidase [Cryphonectria parasitica EP155]
MAVWHMLLRCVLGGASRWALEHYRGDQYLLGVGKGDITGPVVEINLMGYADPSQVGTGLRQRLYSRAFIVGDVTNPSDRFVYLVLDTQSGDTAVRYGILSGLRDLGPEYAVYGQHNVAVTGTHSHSGPAGWLNYLLPQITSKGFDRQGYQAIVDGAILSIVRAHESLQPGHLSIGSTKVQGANINRSLFAYLANPVSERARYNTSSEDDGSVEKDLSLLKFQRASDGRNIGALTWFPTHGTSMLGNNTIITGDNKGVAAYLFEKSVVGEATAAEGFVAGFSQANVGDTSPNVLGAWCEDGSGQMCTLENSTCPGDGRVGKCHARGPHFRLNDSGTSSCFEIGRRQFAPARALYDELNVNPVPVRGPWVKSFHTFHDMSNFTFALPNGSIATTCPAALGYSFAAGTSDGPGVFDFTQHDGDPSNTSPVWKVVSNFLKAPSDEQRACQGSKPILLDVGEVHKPYAWTPNVVDVQVFRVGQFMIIVSPGEASTMAGRRWKEAVQSESAALFQDNYDLSGGALHSPAPVVVLGGPANSYTHYITTEEEYSIQRYEGASTLYGPHTLAAYINVTLRYLPFLDASARTPPPHSKDLFPPDNTKRSLSFITGVVRDGTPLGRAFGEVKQDVSTFYRIGTRITATFVGANPRNNLRLEGTYAAVEKLSLGKDGSQVWNVARDDSDWSLVFRWKRTSDILATSEVEITWETDREDPTEVEKGVYRLRYLGDWKSLDGTITAFDGTSSAFTLT